jgi:type I restriction enzyme R subunit
MPTDHREIAFEAAIEDHLLKAAGYSKGDPANFDRERAIDPTVLIPFIKKTQLDTWESLEKLHGAETESVILDDLCKAMDSQGSLAVIRHGFKCFGKLIWVAYFAPAHGMNPDTERLYAANRLTETRQLKYGTRNGNSIDMVLSLNGIPVVTAELKNQLTGQNVFHASKQYQNDRDPNEKIFEFKKRALVHFAVDPDEVYMTTKIDGSKTYFLPFNRGHNRGAGNPPNEHGYRTEYLWKNVWQRDSLLDILARFIHLQVEEKKLGDTRVTREKLIFPRYHQLDVVRTLEADACTSGVGKNYLIQHSAGSGKSNSIAWLAHRLASLHDDKDEKVFHSVIVITDRVVLDHQLQDTIYQFEHRQGVVEKIDERSTQLANALVAGTPIIVTTLQKFPFVTEKVGDLPERRYAVIVDEAHSSQSGETATELKGVLAGKRIKEEAREQAILEDKEDYEEEIIRTMLKRGRQDNISFFAFTATPKYKTLEVFGTLGDDGKPEPCHLYSMKQAIEEEFILDVLKNYTTYDTFYKLIKSIEDDPKVEKRKAAQALARYMSLHPHNIAQKVDVMLEHFWTTARHKIGGKAKAMVATSSRLHAVRYKQEFDKQIAEKGYSDVKTLVAFSGSVEDPDAPGTSYSEPEMNKDQNGTPLPEKQLPEKFATDQYGLLIVAEKYQTGFDQPLLHTMYVDKRLAGIQAVQTLSRLNRKHPGKGETFVLDFVNKHDEIYEAFKPYYEAPQVGDQVDPSQLYELQFKLESKQVFHLDEVDQLCRAFFKGKAVQTKADHSKLYGYVDPAVERWKLIKEEDDREDFRALLQTFRSLYSFMSQIIPFHDSDLEKLYTFVRFLLMRLPHPPTGPKYDFEDEVALQYYRLEKKSEKEIDLVGGEGTQLKGPTAVGTGKRQSPKVELSSLIDQLNVRFATDFTPADQLFLEQIREDALANEHLRQAAFANTLENFRFVFEKAVQNLFIDRMEQNEEITTKFLNDSKFKGAVSNHLMNEVYAGIRKGDADD